MQEDDETTAIQLQSSLATHGIYVSLATIPKELTRAWMGYRGSAYFQL